MGYVGRGLQLIVDFQVKKPGKGNILHALG